MAVFTKAKLCLPVRMMTVLIITMSPVLCLPSTPIAQSWIEIMVTIRKKMNPIIVVVITQLMSMIKKD